MAAIDDRIAALQAAYDQLISGGAVTRVVSGGRQKDMKPADAGTLLAEIEKLKCEREGGAIRGAVGFRW